MYFLNVYSVTVSYILDLTTSCIGNESTPKLCEVRHAGPTSRDIPVWCVTTHLSQHRYLGTVAVLRHKQLSFKRPAFGPCCTHWIQVDRIVT